MTNSVLLEVGGSYVPPTGATIRSKYRRHWYEIVAEVSDAVWWTAVLFGFSLGIYQLTLEPRMWSLMLLSIYAIGHMAVEIASWQSEWFYIVDLPTGKRKIVKEWGVFRKRSIEDAISPTEAALEQESRLVERMLGFRRCTLKFASRVYIDGRRVPAEFVRELNEPAVKPAELDMNNERMILVQMLPSLVNQGFVSNRAASDFYTNMLYGG